MSVIKNGDTKNPMTVKDSDIIQTVIGDTLKFSPLSSSDTINTITPKEAAASQVKSYTYTVPDLSGASTPYTETLTIKLK
jgi:hypothetical protein